MPIVNREVTLSNTTPIEIAEAHNMPHDVHLHNMSKSSNSFVHLGNADMTLTNSVHIDPGESITLRLQPTDALFAMSNPNGVKVGVLDIRKVN